MRKLLLLLGVCGSLFGATTTITDTLKNADGTNWNGKLIVTAPAIVTTGGASVGPWETTLVIRNGALSIALEPNDTATPSGTSYAVRYLPLNGTGRLEYWVVTTSGSALRVSDVRVSEIPTPSIAITLSQLVQGGATSGQCLVWNGTTWAPASCAAGGGSGITTLNTLTAGTQLFATGTSGSDFNISSATDTHTFNFPTASATKRGLLSSTDWSTFNGKQDAITTGTTSQYFRGDLSLATFPTLPANTTATASNFFTAYNSTTGAFTKAQPAFSDISGTASTGQIPDLSATYQPLDGDLTTIGGLAKTDDSLIVANGTTWQLKTLTTCVGTGKAVTYDASTNTFGCNTITGGSGDVVGPASATDNAVARFDSTTGKLIQDSSVTIDDSGNLTAASVTTGDGTVAGELLAYELSANGSNYISWLAPDSITNTLRLLLPNADPSGGQVLSFGTPSSNISTGSWVTPGTVTSIATTSPITGGTITGTGTIACATCVTSAASLTSNQLVLGAGSQATATLGSLGTTTTVLHGNASGAPSFGAIVNADISNSTIDLTTKVTGILPSANGGTANGFTKFSGPATSEKTFTLPNASATILTDNALVTAAQGGTANGFFAVSGPATSTKTFTFPNASATVLTDNALVTAAQGGTSNGFFAVSGPATSTKTFTFPNASATVLTDNAVVTIAQGGTGTGSTLTGLVRGGSSAFTAAELSGDVTTSGSNATTIATNAVTPAKLSSAAQDGSMVYCADAGSSDTYACTLSPAPGSYVTGSHYRFKANTANTGAASINFNSLGAKTIKKVAGGVTTDLADNDIRVGQIVEVAYDGTNMQMQSTLGNAASAASGGAYTASISGTSVTVAGATHALGTCDLSIAAYETVGTVRNLYRPSTVTCETAAGANQYDVTATFPASVTGSLTILKSGGTSGAAVTFDQVNTGTNTTATMTCGAGCTITTASTGVNNANQYKGNSTVAVADGGTGATTLTGILKGNGTSAFTAVTAPTGTIVGTSDSQTLTNKTLTTPTIGDFTNATHTHTSASTGGQLRSAILTTFCTGGSMANGTVFMPGFGGVLTTCTGLGTTRTGGMKMAGSGTIKNLAVNMGTGGKTNDAVTIEKGGVAQSVTCTYGTGTSCTDTSNSFTFASGDVITIKVATGASETTANLSITFEVWN